MRLGALAAVATATLAAGLLVCPPAAAQSVAATQDDRTGPPARFALILGVNRSVDPDAPLLRYADDDAAKYQELFRGLGARTYLVARLDANTQRTHPQAAAEAREPIRSELSRTLDELATDVRLARERHVRTIVYVAYSGHGNTENDRAYLSLEDGRLFGSDLDDLIFDRLGATEYHLIVDACHADLLASARGPGGQRREVHDFVTRPGVRSRPNMGMLFSTSPSGQSHEWQGVEGGIFSHEVRSGLYGAADADGDGLVTYAEIASFVERANAAIPAERFRPDVYARPPQSGGALVDLRELPGRRIEIQRGEHAHYMLEDGAGVQVAEFHSGADQAVTLVQPPRSGPLYLRRLDDDAEFTIPLAPRLVRLAELSPEVSPIASRGAASDAFGKIFALPFGPRWVVATEEERADGSEKADRRPGAWRPLVGWSLIGVGVASAATGGALALAARQARDGLASDASQAQADALNRTLQARAWQVEVSLGVGAAASVAGVALLLWPSGEPRLQVHVATTGFGVSGSF